MFSDDTLKKRVSIVCVVPDLFEPAIIKAEKYQAYEKYKVSAAKSILKPSEIEKRIQNSVYAS